MSNLKIKEIELNFNPGKELIENLENIRLKKNITKTQFAKQNLGITPSYYSRIINKQINPTLETIGELSRNLGVDYSALLMSSTSQNMIIESQQNVFQHMKDVFSEIHKLEDEKRHLEELLKQKTNNYEMTT